MRRRLAYTAMAGAAALGLAGSVSPAMAATDPPMKQVSGGDPYTSCSIGAGPSSVDYPHSAVGPSVALDPRDPKHFVGGFQQDRWNDSGAKGIVGVYSYDGKHVGETAMPFSECAGGLPYQRASDIWLSYGHDGIVYAGAIGFDETTPRSAVSAAVSYNGGRTWRNAQTVIADDSATVFNDKPSITADPTRPGTAYLTWDREVATSSMFEGTAEVSITHDGGRTWSAPHVMAAGPAGGDWMSIGENIVVDPRTGTLYDVFTWLTYTDPTGASTSDVHIGLVKSTDGGRTWSRQIDVARDTAIQNADPNDPKQLLRTGGDAAIAVDPATGELYVVDETTDFTGGAYDQIALWHSTDGGATWSAPSRISQSPAPAFTPAIAVDRRGTVSITYYDLRYLPAGDTTTLPTASWLLTFPRGGQARATERQIAPLFDWLQAPAVSGGHFLGDNQGLAAAGAVVRPFVTTTANAPTDPADVFTGEFCLGGFGAVRPPAAVGTAAAPDRVNGYLPAERHRQD